MGFFASIFLLNGLAHYAVYTWLTRFSLFSTPKRKRALALALAVLAALPVIARISKVDALTHAGRIEFMTIVLGAVFFAAASVVIKAATKRHQVVPPEASASDAPMNRRDALTKVAGAAAFGTSGALCGWGYVRGRHDYQVEEVVIRVARLPKSLDGYTIAQVSDIHVGPFVAERELEEGFSKIRAIRPDLIVATGDLVDMDAEVARLLASRLTNVPSRDGHVVIPGNHDYYAGAERVLGAFRAAGAHALVNRSIRVREKDRGGIAILGVDDLWARAKGGAGPNLDRALEGVGDDVPRILLAHQPNFFTQSRGRVDVQLSGHTHGGQIHLGFNPAAFIFHYVVGRYEEQGTTLWVNRGFGVAGPPARIGVPPEITKIVLVAG